MKPNAPLWRSTTNAPPAAVWIAPPEVRGDGSTRRPNGNEGTNIRRPTPKPLGGPRSHVIFGSGAIAQTAAEIEKLGHVRSLVLSTPNQKTDAEALAHRLAALCVGVFADAAMHTPVHVTELALAEAGRPPGSAKRSPSAPARDQVVIPTTYAGSEMTDILGETVGGEKTTRIC